MKRKLLVTFLLFISFTSLLAFHIPDDKNQSRGYHVEIGDKVSNISLIITNGDTLFLSDFYGKVIVLQFTASWCSVCRKEMPHLENEIWQKYKNDNFILIGVDYDEPLDKVIAFKEKMKVTYPMALDPDGKIFQMFAYKGSGVTRNVVIDKEGKIAYLTRLFDKNEFKGMKDKIAELLAD